MPAVMNWAQAVKVWNSHKKSVNPAHVYALPRKGTPEHAHVKHIQQGGHPESFGAVAKAVGESAAAKARSKKADKKHQAAKLEAEAAAKKASEAKEAHEKMVAERKTSAKKEVVKKFLEKAVAKRKAAKAAKTYTMEQLRDFNVIEIDGIDYGLNIRGDVVNKDGDWMGHYDTKTKKLNRKAPKPADWDEITAGETARELLNKLPAELEVDVKAMVGDINEQKRMERFKTQMKGLDKLRDIMVDFFNKEGRYDPDGYGRFYYDDGDYNWTRFSMDFRLDSPEFIQNILTEISKNGTGYGTDKEGIITQWKLGEYIDIIKGIIKMGQRFLKGNENDVIIYEEENIEPPYSPEISESDFEPFDEIFVYKFYVYGEGEKIYPERDEDEEDEDEDEEDEDLPYNYYVQGSFRKERSDVVKRKRERERAVSKLGYKARDILRKAKVEKAIKAFVAKRRAQKAERQKRRDAAMALIEKMKITPAPKDQTEMIGGMRLGKSRKE